MLCLLILMHPGWFTEPTPFFTGGLSAEEAVPVLNEVMEQVMEVLSDLPPAKGGLAMVKVWGGVKILEPRVNQLLKLIYLPTFVPARRRRCLDSAADGQRVDRRGGGAGLAGGYAGAAARGARSARGPDPRRRPDRRAGPAGRGAVPGQPGRQRVVHHAAYCV